MRLGSRLSLLSLCSCLLVLGALARGRAQEGDKPYAPTFPKDLPFDAKDWLTNDKYAPIGDPKAKRDVKDPFVIRWDAFPPTLRTQGPNSNLLQTHMIHNLMYESLIQLHPDTQDYIPCLASHWQIETDEKAGQQRFTFRIDPRARWADGSEVTADDVHKTWWHRMQEDRQDPSSVLTYKQYLEPEILDKHTVRVRTKELNWRTFLYFGGMAIYPAKEIAIPGKRYLEEYDWKFQMGSGPYILKPEDLKKGESLTVTRRSDWWAENEPWGKNTGNFAKVKGVVVLDEELEYEMFKKGELNYVYISRAQRWVQECPKEEIVKKGWVKQRRMFNQAQRGFAGFAFNMREKPFDDKRVRLAFCHLFNRERLMEKLFFNQYEYLNSYEPGGDWGNEEENPPVMFDAKAAAELLAQAGYAKRGDDGFLIGPDGQRLEVTLEFGIPSFERVWLVVKEDYEKAGVKFNLKLIDGPTLIKKITERQFKIHFQSWGSIPFPNPETSWLSELADKPNNNNITGFKNKRVDELCKKYNVTFDRAEQKKITREIDKIIYDEHPYALGWYANYVRLLYWDRFGHPDTYLTRTSDDYLSDIMGTWWYDADRMKALEEARASGKTLEQGEIDVRPWDKKK